MRVHVTDLKNGDQLSRDVFNDNGLQVLSGGTALSSQEIARLLRHKIDYVDIEARKTYDTITRTLETTVSPKWLPAVKPLYENAVHMMAELFAEASGHGQIDMRRAAAVFTPLLNNLQMERDVVSMLLLLNTKDDYACQHSVQVGMLSYYLASWVGYSNEEAIKIGKAGYLHNIGNCMLDTRILNKPGELTNEEFEKVKCHTVYGYEILTASSDDHVAAIGALQHHERFNGTGYPEGLSGDRIHPVAKIVAVADIYSAMISERVYRKKRDLWFVLKELYRLSFSELDPYTTQTFIKHMMPNFIGKRIELSNGESGIIVLTHPTEFFQPLIQVDDRFIDLTLERDYEIEHVYL